MADTNCTVEKSNVLTQAPKLLEKSQLNLDILEKIKKSTAVSLFKKDGVPVSKLLSFNCFSGSGLAEIKDHSILSQKLRVSATCKDNAFFVNLGCKF